MLTSMHSYYNLKRMILGMNQESETRKQKLMAASLLVRKESMKVNAEFEAIENDPEG